MRPQGLTFFGPGNRNCGPRRRSVRLNGDSRRRRTGRQTGKSGRERSFETPKIGRSGQESYRGTQRTGRKRIGCCVRPRRSGRGTGDCSV